jgi:mRNA interferase RelE/StbE
VSRYRISIQRDALRALAKLDKPVRRRIQTAIDRLADDPRPAGVRALTGRPGVLRLRVGDYRVIYQVHDLKLLVLVVDLGHRSAIYRD